MDTYLPSGVQLRGHNDIEEFNMLLQRQQREQNIREVVLTSNVNLYFQVAVAVVVSSKLLLLLFWSVGKKIRPGLNG